MKKRLLMTGMLACMLMFGTKVLYAQTVPLDTAINNVVDEFSYNLKKGSKIAIVAVRSSSARMSKYIVEELTSAFVNQRMVTVVGRAQLEQLQEELKFQMFGEVNDSLAQTVGKRVGAQSVITGSFEQVGNYYRFRVRVIEVDTAAINVTYSANVQNDQAVASLMGSSTSNPSASASASASTAPQEDYEDFSGGQRFGTWALNSVVPGLGSYVIMHDKNGGTTQLIMGIVSEVFLIAGYASYVTALASIDSYSNYSGSSYNSYADALAKAEQDLQRSTVILGIGGILGTVNAIYNIVRSSSYHKPQPGTASLFDSSALNIVFLPARNGSIDKVRLSYTMRF